MDGSILRHDFVHHALIGSAAEDGGSVKVLAGFVEDQGAGGFGAIVPVGESVENTIRPFATGAWE